MRGQPTWISAAEADGHGTEARSSASSAPSNATSTTDRRELRQPPEAETVRAIVAYLRSRSDRVAACRMAIVVAVGVPDVSWRNAEVLAGQCRGLTVE